MAKFRLNKMVESATGKVGKNMTFKTVGRTILFTATPEQKGEVSERQREHRERFRRAAAYARRIMSDPEVKAAYEQKVRGQDFRNAFNAAVADYLKPPYVESLNTAAYSGNADEKITVRVYDDFKVAAVHVIITQANGTLVETGEAAQIEGSNTWEYLTTQPNTVLAGTKVEVVVTDKPGNITRFQHAL